MANLFSDAEFFALITDIDTNKVNNKNKGQSKAAWADLRYMVVHAVPCGEPQENAQSENETLGLKE
jgi:hypothetical protein